MPEGDHITALYRWTTGDCFNCARKGLPTTRVADVTVGRAGPVEVRACERCVLMLEAQRQQACARRGEEYVPGRLGERRK